mgnify:CR=1 FL=1
MTLAIVHTRAGLGLEAPEVQVEVHLANGLPGMTLVGLPETAVKESRERVRSALVNAGFDYPLRRITLNLAPADLPKEGGRFDLPIALGLLLASGQLPPDALQATESVGELALDGRLRHGDGNPQELRVRELHTCARCLAVIEQNVQPRRVKVFCKQTRGFRKVLAHAGNNDLEIKRRHRSRPGKPLVVVIRLRQCRHHP